MCLVVPSIVVMRTTGLALARHAHRSFDCLSSGVCPAAAARARSATALTHSISHATFAAPSTSISLSSTAFFSSSTPLRSTISTRLQLRRRSSTFVPIDPSAITIPASVVKRISNSSQADDDTADDDNDDSSDADDAELVDRSLDARRMLFRTVQKLQRMEASGLSMEYVDAIVDSLAAHKPLLPREQVHIAALYAHMGRETEAVRWIGRLLREGLMTAEWAEMVRKKAERAALVGLEERMNRIVKTMKADNATTAATAAMADNTAPTAST